MMYQRYNNSGAYKAKCAIAEKLGDQQLRKWCVEQVGPFGAGVIIDYEKVDALFIYIKKKREKTTNEYE